MKVAELRAKLSKLKKEEIIKLTVEFYKLVPKSKKEDYGLDNMVDNPSVKKVTKTANATLSLDEIEFQLKNFIENARAQNYLVPNRVIPKKERPKWRFTAKKIYKALINTKRNDANLKIQSKLLTDLYELLCESCGYQYFSGYDTFQSVGIEQSDFYKSVILLMQEAQGKTYSVNKGIELIVDNYLNRYTLYSTLMAELISTLDIPDLKYQGIEKVKQLIIKNNFSPKEKNSSWSNEVYKKEKRNNNLAEMGFRLHFSLFELKEGVQFYKIHYFDSKKEIKLYVLIRILIELEQKEQIVIELETAIRDKIKPRQRLLDVLESIKKHNELPKYF